MSNDDECGGDQRDCSREMIDVTEKSEPNGREVGYANLNRGGRPKGSLNKRTSIMEGFKKAKINPNKEVARLLVSPNISDEKKLDAWAKFAKFIWTAAPQEIEVNTNERREVAIKVMGSVTGDPAMQTALEKFLGIATVIDGEATELDESADE